MTKAITSGLWGDLRGGSFVKEYKFVQMQMGNKCSWKLPQGFWGDLKVEVLLLMM